jgi:hypothetical protein
MHTSLGGSPLAPLATPANEGHAARMPKCDLRGTRLNTATARRSSRKSILMLVLLGLVLTLVPTVSANAATIYAATSNNRLISRDTSSNSPSWAPVGPGPDNTNITAMTNGTGSKLLWATTTNNGLYFRAAAKQESGWVYWGHANGVVALAADADNLYAVTSDGLLWTRTESAGLPVGFNRNWTIIDSAPHVSSMTAVNGRLYATTNTNRLLIRQAQPFFNGGWTDIGHANNVVGVTAVDSALFAATSDNRLWDRPGVTSNHDWTPIDSTPSGVIDLASTP